MCTVSHAVKLAPAPLLIRSKPIHLRLNDVDCLRRRSSRLRERAVLMAAAALMPPPAMPPPAKDAAAGDAAAGDAAASDAAAGEGCRRRRCRRPRAFSCVGVAVRNARDRRVHATCGAGWSWWRWAWQSQYWAVSSDRNVCLFVCLFVCSRDRSPPP